MTSTVLKLRIYLCFSVSLSLFFNGLCSKGELRTTTGFVVDFSAAWDTSAGGPHIVAGECQIIQKVHCCC